MKTQQKIPNSTRIRQIRPIKMFILKKNARISFKKLYTTLEKPPNKKKWHLCRHIEEQQVSKCADVVRFQFSSASRFSATHRTGNKCTNVAVQCEVCSDKLWIWKYNLPSHYKANDDHHGKTIPEEYCIN